MTQSSYAPDDARMKVAALETLHSAADLRAVIAGLPDPANPTVSQVAALRKKFSADLLHAGLTLAALQARGKAKFPALPYLWATPEALEQASSAAVARHKASRFAHAGVSHILDLCCGIGGDALALAGAAPVTAVDLSPVRTTCLRYNLEQHPTLHPVEIQTGDIRKLLPLFPKAAFFHIDPSRRQSTASGRLQRSARYEDLIPGPEVIDQLIRQFPGGVIKLSSAVDFDTLPPGHLELISEHGTVVQALLWLGRFTDSLPVLQRTATIVGETIWSLSAAPSPATLELVPPLQGLTGYLYEVDGSLTRASLAGPYAAKQNLITLTPDGGYLLGDHLLHDAPLTAFQILDALPFSEARVAQALAQFSNEAAGAIEVKTRGGLPGIDTDRLQRQWTKEFPHKLTVLIFRHADDVAAVIARRLPPSP